MDCQASLSLNISRGLPKFMSIALGMPSHPLTPSSPFALNLYQHQDLFQWVSCSHQKIKILEFQLQHQSFQWVFNVDFPYDWLVWSFCPKTFRSLLQHHSSKTPILWYSVFFTVQLSQPYVTTGETIALTVWTLSAEECLCSLTHCLGLS